MIRKALVVAVSFLAVSCSPTVLKPEDYRTDCSEDADCAIVILGDICGTCGGTQSAIHVDDVDKAESDQGAARALCLPDFSGVSCAAPLPMDAVCRSGTCAAVPPSI